jgi:hypothetical protein
VSCGRIGLTFRWGTVVGVAFGTVERRGVGCRRPMRSRSPSVPVAAALRETVEAFDLARGPEGASWEFSDLVI